MSNEREDKSAELIEKLADSIMTNVDFVIMEGIDEDVKPYLMVMLNQAYCKGFDNGVYYATDFLEKRGTKYVKRKPKK